MKAKKIIIFIIMITFVVLISLVLSDDSLFTGEIKKLDNKIERELREEHGIVLPDSVEFIDGEREFMRNSSILSIHFYIPLDALDTLFIGEWVLDESSFYRAGHYDRYTESKNIKMYYNKNVEYTYLYYEIHDDKIECIFVGFK